VRTARRGSREGDVGTARDGGRTGSWWVLGFLLPVAAHAVACTPATPPEDLAPRARFEWAHERFDREDWGAAERGFRDFLFRQPLPPMVDSAQYLLGEAQYRSEKYLEAAESFQRLALNRPTSPLADDAQFGVCRSYWELVPDLALDQSYARQTEEACQRLLQFYLPTPLEDEARGLLRLARDRLAAKRYRTAHWYYDRKIYESANIYLEEILEVFPETEIVPEVMVTLFRSYRAMGFDQEARAIRRRLMQNYPGTEEAEEIEREPLPGSP